jgi:uncharacterized protein YdiU (UPF0061 family)
MAVNNAVLAESFLTIISHYTKEESAKERIKYIAEVLFAKEFIFHYSRVKRAKLGLSKDPNLSPEALDADDRLIDSLYSDLEVLMQTSSCDFTIFFRSLAQAAGCPDANEALSQLQDAFYRPLGSAPS